MQRAIPILLVCFGVPVGQAAAQPAAGPKQENPAATKLLAEARAARALWTNFPGFTADVEANFDGKIHRGKVAVAANGKVQVEMTDEAAGAWVKRELTSLVMHRLASAGGSDTPCTFGQGPADHPQGATVIVLNDELHSSYRIKDRQILEVNRTMKDTRFTITVLENVVNQEKHYLPGCFVVNTWDLKNKELRSSTAYHQTWQRLGAFDLPATLSVVTASATGLESKALKFTNCKLP